ncbi:uncharacterized protein LOC143666125 [Tamandua tetradactyla]|uniref:uncharacterized protein LOC143666125 n=1 Tax=Tamandua tetradactyla TaxID=48850 RepID=UPI0040541E08
MAGRDDREKQTEKQIRAPLSTPLRNHQSSSYRPVSSFPPGRSLPRHSPAPGLAHTSRCRRARSHPPQRNVPPTAPFPGEGWTAVSDQEARGGGGRVWEPEGGSCPKESIGHDEETRKEVAQGFCREAGPSLLTNCPGRSSRAASSPPRPALQAVGDTGAATPVSLGQTLRCLGPPDPPHLQLEAPGEGTGVGRQHLRPGNSDQKTPAAEPSRSTEPAQRENRTASLPAARQSRSRNARLRICCPASQSYFKTPGSTFRHNKRTMASNQD